MSINRGKTEQNYFPVLSIPGNATQLFIERVKSISTLLEGYPRSTVKWEKK